MSKNKKTIKNERHQTTLIALAAVALVVGYAFFAQPLAYNTAMKVFKKISDVIDIEKDDPENNSDKPGTDTKRPSNIKSDGTIIKTDKPSDNTNINSENWNIGFTKVIKTGIYGYAAELSPVKFDSLSASFNVALTGPEDKVSYEFTITNSGSLNAVVDSIELVSNKSEDDTIIFKISDIEVGDKLAIGESTTMTITVEYNLKTDEAVKYYSENAQIIINYVQD